MGHAFAAADQTGSSHATTFGQGRPGPPSGAQSFTAASEQPRLDCTSSFNQGRPGFASGAQPYDAASDQSRLDTSTFSQGRPGSCSGAQSHEAQDQWFGVAASRQSQSSDAADAAEVSLGRASFGGSAQSRSGQKVVKQSFY